MKHEELVDLLVRLTIEKAKKDNRHPREVLEEVKKLIENRRLFRERIEQAVNWTVWAN